MNQKQSGPQPAITLSDIYYVLFRRKWLIIGVSLVAIASAVGIYLFYPFPYQSEAKVFIRYVMDTSTDIRPDAQMHSPDRADANVLNSELELLTSRDVARKAAEVVGPERILGGTTHDTNAEQAAAVISKKLITELPKNDDVITLKFSNPDPSVVQAVLSQLISAYKDEHRRIHIQDGLTEDFLEQQADLAKSRLDDAEKQRHYQMNSVGILSFDDAKKGYSDQLSRLQQQIDDANADLSQARASIEELQKMYPQLAASEGNTSNTAAVAPVPAGKMKEYETLLQNLSTLQARQDSLLTEVTTNNPEAQAGQDAIDKAEKAKEKMEADWPALLVANVPNKDGNGPAKATPQEMMDGQILKVREMEARIAVLTNLVATVQTNMAVVGTAEASVTGFTATKEAEEDSYKHLLASVDNARISNALGPGRVSNIGEVESPTPPMRNKKLMMKLCAGILFGGIALSLAMAFVLELYFNTTFRHPIDVQNKLPFPFFVSIPKTSGRFRARFLAPSSIRLSLPPARLPGQNGATANGSEAAENGEADNGATVNGATVNGDIDGDVMAAVEDVGKMAPWDEKSALRPYFESLRDRLIAYFEMINLTHKPKLVAVTSCGSGAGVTTAAAGLAASLSETGDGNVLLVNMNVQEGEAHHFYKGKLTCGLDQALDKDQRSGAMVQENLYVAKDFASNESLPRVLPKRFSNLVPKMKASDFDYIIFDMPPISQISITPRLARFMDMVLMVVESEKTDREVAKRAAAMLAETKTNVGVILNKSRSYVPKRLQQDL